MSSLLLAKSFRFPTDTPRILVAWLQRLYLLRGGEAITEYFLVKDIIAIRDSPLGKHIKIDISINDTLGERRRAWVEHSHIVSDQENRAHWKTLPRVSAKSACRSEHTLEVACLGRMSKVDGEAPALLVRQGPAMDGERRRIANVSVWFKVFLCQSTWRSSTSRHLACKAIFSETVTW